MKIVDPTRRQVLVHLGNRFVVFGPDVGLPEPVRFDPKDSPILPRVTDEADAAEAQILETLQIFGMTRSIPDASRAVGADIEFTDANGSRVLIEVKVRESDPKQGDLQLQADQLKQANTDGVDLEVWFFNTEKLKLTVLRRTGRDIDAHQLIPLNVWERTTEGTFERQRVVEEVDEWTRRLQRLYADLQNWLSDNQELRCEQSRSITMSDEMMQRFAVADRELPVLDVLRANDVVASFVPRGLWLIGAWGRVDAITSKRTSILVALKKGEQLEWHLTSDDRRHPQPFDKAAALELMGAQ